MKARMVKLASVEEKAFETAKTVSAVEMDV